MVCRPKEIEMITAIKPVFDRTTQTFSPDVRENADVLLAHCGFFVFDDPAKALEALRAGQWLTHWTPRKRQCVIDCLAARCGG